MKLADGSEATEKDLEHLAHVFGAIAKPRKFRAPALELIRQANVILSASSLPYGSRAVAYRLIALGEIDPRTGKPYANTEKVKRHVTNVLADARDAGLVDWDKIADDTRELVGVNSWDSAADFLKDVIPQFNMDKWSDQPRHVELWTEKHGLAGVFRRVCRDLEIPFLAHGGFSSKTMIHDAAERFIDYGAKGQKSVILYVGDHDPAGLRMTATYQRDLLKYGAPSNTEVVRVALTLQQATGARRLPPFTAKTADRANTRWYVQTVGTRDCWEVDALTPQELDQLVRRAVLKRRDEAKWKASENKQERERRKLSKELR